MVQLISVILCLSVGIVSVNALSKYTSECFSECTDKPMMYTNCSGKCNEYVECDDHGQSFDRVCAEGTVWMGIMGCTYGPDCTDRAIAPPTDSPPIPPPSCPYGYPCCISSCINLQIGDYQSCNSCSEYITCGHNGAMDIRRCPADTEWDDYAKECRHVSSSCVECIYPGHCYRYPDGFYQYCASCGGYIECKNGRYIFRTCYGSLWDNKEKMCLQKSSTCGKDCRGFTSGQCYSPEQTWHICAGCKLYTECVRFNNRLYYNTKYCQDGLEWDQEKQMCVTARTSQTCGIEQPPKEEEEVYCHSYGADRTMCRWDIGEGKTVRLDTTYLDNSDTCILNVSFGVDPLPPSNPTRYELWTSDECCGRFILS